MRLQDEEIALWKQALKETGIGQVMSHGSYLINLGSPDHEILCKSRKAFLEELNRCHALKIPYLNFHPGAATGATENECLQTIIDSSFACRSEPPRKEKRECFWK